MDDGLGVAHRACESCGLSVVRLRTTDRPLLVVDSHGQMCNLKLTISHLGYEPFLAADVPFPLKSDIELPFLLQCPSAPSLRSRSSTTLPFRACSLDLNPFLTTDNPFFGDGVKNGTSPNFTPSFAAA